MRHRISFSVFFLLCGAEGLVAMLALINAPADPKNAFAFGFSLTRIAILAGTILFASILIALAVTFFRSEQQSAKMTGWIAERARTILTISIITLFIFIWFYFVPDYRILSIIGYIERARPVLIWLMLISAQAVLGSILLIKPDWNTLRANLIEEKKMVKAQALIFIFFLIMWILIAVSGIGITPDRLYWNENGVPLLPEQIVIAWMITALIAAIIPRLGAFIQTRIDLILFIAIWIITIFVWNAQPIQRSFFLPQPVKPNFSWYPFSDAAAYDIGGRAILLGNGVNDSKFTDKPLYMLFVALTRLIGGENYADAIFIQIIVLALAPALLYLIGKELHSRKLGALLASMAVFKEINTIGATLDIQVSHSKLFLTEPMTALLLILFARIMIRWMKAPHEKSPLLMIAGVVIGLTGLVRLNPLLIAPFAALIFLPLLKFDIRKWIIAVSLFAISATLVLAPWMITAKDEKGKNFLLTKIERVVERYTAKTQPPDKKHKSQTTPAAGTITPAPTSTYTSQEQIELSRQKNIAESSDNILQFAPAHFIHNEVASLTILPLSLALDDIRQTVASPLWDSSWKGSISAQNGFWILINLAIIAIGTGAAWSYARHAGLVPLIVHASYHLANGVARTSGSRYLVPVDWALLFYYALGLIQIAFWINVLLKSKTNSLQPGSSSPSPTNSKSAWIVVTSVMVIAGMALPIANSAFPKTYPPQNNEIVLDEFLRKADISEMLFQEKELNDLAGNEFALMFKAQIYYPRYLDLDKGFCVTCMGTDRAYSKRSYGRLAMLAIGSYTASVDLPLAKSPEPVPDGAEAIVIGCFRSKNIDLVMIDALYVYFIKENLLLTSNMPQNLTCAKTILEKMR